jgi:hypothetical protein
MKLTSVLSALILLLFSGILFSFSPKVYNTYSSNFEFQETFDIENDIEKGSYLNFDINLFFEINFHKVHFFPITREYRYFNSTEEIIAEAYYCPSHLINPSLNGTNIIYPFHSFL